MPNPPNNNDLQGNYYMTVNFLDNRIANKELFGFKSHLNDTIQHMAWFYVVLVY